MGHTNYELLTTRILLATIFCNDYERIVIILKNLNFLIYLGIGQVQFIYIYIYRYNIFILKYKSSD